jgi:phosphatidylglycerophosphate synthase
MSPNNRSGPRRAHAGAPELLLRAALLMVIIITAIIVVIRADAWWTSLLAAAGVAVGACGVVLVALALLSDEDDAEPEAGPSRTGSVALGSVAIVLIVLALVVPEHEAQETTANAAGTARSADETVRQFLLEAIVEDDAYPSCQYLTTGQQATLARQAGATSCRLALTSTSPSLDGVENEGDIDRLKIRATVVGDRATAVVSGRDRPPVTFTLARATPAEVEAFEAPSTPWRIAAGAEALVA